MGTTSPQFDRTTTATTVATAFSFAIAGRTFLITGVSPTGIGGATAQALATQKPKLLILSGRRSDPVSQVITSIHTQDPHVNCRWLPLDLSSPASVRSAADILLLDSMVPAIDVLINNAGMAVAPGRTISEATGAEIQFATNHLGHFLLTKLLMPKLRGAPLSSLPSSDITSSNKASSGRKAATRIINLSSNAHFYSPVRFSDINWRKPDAEIPEPERPNWDFINARALEDRPENGQAKEPALDKHYVPMGAYGQSKTANILFTLGLNQRYYSSSPPSPGSSQTNDEAKRGKIASFAVHPGVIRTDLFRNLGGQENQDKRFRKLNKDWKSLNQGAATTLVAALDPALTDEDVNEGLMRELEGEEGVGVPFYLSDCQIAQRCAPYARDAKMADSLWRLSEKLLVQDGLR